MIRNTTNSGNGDGSGKPARRRMKTGAELEKELPAAVMDFVAIALAISSTMQEAERMIKTLNADGVVGEALDAASMAAQDLIDALWVAAGDAHRNAMNGGAK